nr:hypothetical protein [Tanacetum cinerariifolium]
MKVKESLNVTFNESPPPTKLSSLVDDDVGEEEVIKKNTRVVNNNYEEVEEVINIKEFKNHPLDYVIGNVNQRTLSEFEMSMMGELNFFLGLQIKQIENEIFFNQSKYIKEMLKKFGLEDSKPTKTLMSTEIKLTKDDEADSVGSYKYRENEIFFNQSKYIKEMLKKFGLEDSKPTKTLMSTEIKLTKDDEADSVGSYKYRALAISTTKAEYVLAGKACQQALWMKQALIDYEICLDDVLIMCDNKGAIDLSKNPIQHLELNI